MVATVVPGDRVLGMAQIIEKCHFCRRKIYMMMEAGEFPQPTKFGKAIRWRESAIDQWIAATMDATGNGYDAIIVTNPESGGKETICPDCHGPDELLEAESPVYLPRPNRLNFTNDRAYQNAIKVGFQCSRCKVQLNPCV